MIDLARAVGVCHREEARQLYGRVAPAVLRVEQRHELAELAEPQRASLEGGKALKSVTKTC